MKTVSPSVYIASAFGGMALVLMLLFFIYVAGYFVLPGKDRLFQAEWQFELYKPAIRAEKWVTGKQVTSGYVNSRGMRYSIRLP